MKIYILSGCMDYEGCALLGAYSTHELANCAKEDVTRVYGKYDDVIVQEILLDEKLEDNRKHEVWTTGKE